MTYHRTAGRTNVRSLLAPTGPVPNGMKIGGPGPAALWGMGSCRVVGHGFSRGKRRTVLISRPLQRASPGRLQPGVRQWDERLETGMWDADEAEARTGKPVETGWRNGICVSFILRPDSSGLMR